MKSLKKNYKFWNIASNIFAGFFLLSFLLFLVFGVGDSFNHLKICIICIIIAGVSAFLIDFCENKKADFKFEIIKRKRENKYNI